MLYCKYFLLFTFFPPSYSNILPFLYHYYPSLLLHFRLSSSTEQSSSSQLMRRHKRRRRRHKVAKIDRVSNSETHCCPCWNWNWHWGRETDEGADWYRRYATLTILRFTYCVPFMLFQSSSFSSITDSTMSLNIITVTLNMGIPYTSMTMMFISESDI